MTRRWWVLGTVLVVVLAGCGSGDDDSDAVDDAGPAEATDVEATDVEATDVEATDVEATDAATSVAATSADDASAEPTTAQTDGAPTVDILTDFADACRGVAIPGATAYDPAVTGVHPIMVVAGEHPTYGDVAGANLPDTWDPVVGQEQTVELVVCMARTATTSAQICDGYQDDDGNDSGNTVEVFDVVYDVRLVAATTADDVAATQLEATGEPCPMLVFFEEDEDVKPWYAEPTAELTAWLAAYVET